MFDIYEMIHFLENEIDDVRQNLQHQPTYEDYMSSLSKAIKLENIKELIESVYVND